jgi:hypothetical protein
VRERGRRIVLKIVGRQHAVARRDKSLEEPPCAAGGLPQRLRIGIGHREMTCSTGREAYEPRDGGRSQPERGEGKRHRPRPMTRRQRDDSGGGANENRTRHPVRETHQVKTRADGRLCGWNPFEQTAAAHAEAPERATDRIHHEPRLIRQEHDGQYGQAPGKA